LIKYIINIEARTVYGTCHFQKTIAVVQKRISVGGYLSRVAAAEFTFPIGYAIPAARTADSTV
jgi:hypothetical protein